MSRQGNSPFGNYWYAPPVVVPEGMVVVTKEKFFELLDADPRDIMPDHPSWSPPNQHNWSVVSTRKVWGWSAPGWKNPGAPEIHAVLKEVYRG